MRFYCIFHFAIILADLYFNLIERMMGIEYESNVDGFN